MISGVSAVTVAPVTYGYKPPSGEESAPSRVQESGEKRDDAAKSAAGDEEKTQESETTDGKALSDGEERVVRELKQRDAEVRRHEAAHMAAGGQYVQGGATYTYQRGPDGRQYAIGGEVSIDTAPESTPEETIQKMLVVRRAALAPADPSAADRSVAAAAASAMAQARMELAQEQRSGDEEGGAGLGKPQIATDRDSLAAEYSQSQPDSGQSVDMMM